MSIEVSSAPKVTKAATGADTQGRKAGKTPDAAGSGGFSALMNLLSVTEGDTTGQAPDALLTDAPLTEKDALSADAAAIGGGITMLLQPFPALVQMPLTEGDALLEPPSAAAELAEGVLGAALTSPQAANASLAGALGAGAKLDVGDAASQSVGQAPSQAAEQPAGLTTKVGAHGKGADTGAPQKLSLTSTAGDAGSVSAVAGRAAADAVQASPVSALLAHKSAAQAQTLSAVQQDLKDARASALPQSTGQAAEVATTVLSPAMGDLARPQGRFGARSGSGQAGSSGFEGAFGQAMAATNRSESVFEVPVTSAAVPDSAVAETVSYWASHGVQTAELKLDGFGDAPVEVSILLNGDQAQIEFRTDQAGVRQVLENAAAQLKDMLSSQGLQLAGVSVGSSGAGGDAGGDRRQRPPTQQVTLLKTEALGVAPARAANPAVGRSLDLFV